MPELARLYQAARSARAREVVIGVAGKAGWHHSDETKERLRETGLLRSAKTRKQQGAEKRLPMAEKLARDRALLDTLGRTHFWEWATVADVSEKVARSRLERLHRHGMADRHRERGSTAWTYTAVKS
jgi:N6-adenosine-specific RNA methylase IME4